jgi:tetratricopeptide (TPR) repeat protein
LEEALASFALGRDDVVAELAQQDADIDRILGAALAAAQGRTARASRGLSDTARALHLASNVVARLVARPPDVEGARRTATRIDAANREAVWYDELLATTRLGAKGSWMLLRSTRFKECTELLDALSRETTDIALAPAVQAALRKRRKALASDSALGVASLMHVASLASGAAAQQVAELDIAVFPEDQRGVAVLYGAHAALQSSPERALHLFEKALALGAPLLETLRGHWLAAYRAKDGSPDAQRRLSHSSERLDEALAKDPDALPARCGLALFMARQSVATHRFEAGVRWMKAARDLSAQIGIVSSELSNQLDIGDAALRLDSEPERALALAEAVLARSPSDVTAWQLRIGAGHHMGAASVDDWVLEAAKQTGHVQFQRRAQRIRRRRGTAPFDGFDPSSPPGLLAQEFAEHALRRDSETTTSVLGLAEPHRIGLAVPDRTAFDCAVLVVLANTDRKVTTTWLERQMAEWSGTPGAVHSLATVACRLGLHQDMLRCAEKLARDPRRHGAIREVVSACVANHAPTATRIVQQVSAQLDAAMTRTLMHLVSQRPPVSDTSSLSEIERRLAPHFMLEEALRGGLDDDDDDHDFDDEELDDEELDDEELDDEDLVAGFPDVFPSGELSGAEPAYKAAFGLASILGLMGLDPEALDRLPVQRKGQFLSRVIEILQSPSDDNASTMLQLQTLSREFDLLPPSVPVARRGSGRIRDDRRTPRHPK